MESFWGLSDHAEGSVFARSAVTIEEADDPRSDAPFSEYRQVFVAAAKHRHGVDVEPSAK
jgi:hypothetical protein